MRWTDGGAQRARTQGEGTVGWSGPAAVALAGISTLGGADLASSQPVLGAAYLAFAASSLATGPGHALINKVSARRDYRVALHDRVSAIDRETTDLGNRTPPPERMHGRGLGQSGLADRAREKRAERPQRPDRGGRSQ